MKGQRFFAVACASAMLLVSASAFGLTDDERKCSDAFNKAARNVANQEQKNNRKACVKEGGGEACVAATGAKATDKLAKLNELFLVGEKCEAVPAIGVDQAGANTAVTLGSDTIIRDIFGDPVSGVVAGDKCQDSVAKRSGKIYDTILKVFRKCTKDAVALNVIGDFEACVTTAANDAKVSTFAGKLTNDATNKCDVLPLPGGDDGACAAAATPAALSACAVARTKCNACTAINAYTGGDADCAAISGDPSCGVPSHKCTFDENVDNSNLSLFVGGNTDLSALVTDIAGAIDISCDPDTQDVNGKRSCSCSLQTWTPPQITGIGFICITPGPACPAGEVDCDGGNALGIEAEDSSQIGICASHAACSASCDAHCGGLAKVQWRSGCENLCQGGSRDGLACICDQVGSSGCVGGVAGTDDCPGGSCVGKNNEVDQDCQCQCIDYATGGAGPAGVMQCQLPTDIKVVASLPCANAALVDLPPICAPFSSQQTSGEIDPANEGDSPPIGPNVLIGTSDSCANLDASTTGGYTLVGDFGFFDSTVGDVRTPFTVDCQ